MLFFRSSQGYLPGTFVLFRTSHFLKSESKRFTLKSFWSDPKSPLGDFIKAPYAKPWWQLNPPLSEEFTLASEPMDLSALQCPPTSSFPPFQTPLPAFCFSQNASWGSSSNFLTLCFSMSFLSEGHSFPRLHLWLLGHNPNDSFSVDSKCSTLPHSLHCSLPKFKEAPQTFCFPRCFILAPAIFFQSCRMKL